MSNENKRLICSSCFACANHPEDRINDSCHFCGESETLIQERDAMGKWITIESGKTVKEFSSKQLQLDCQAAVMEKFGAISHQANWMRTRNNNLKLAVETLVNAEEIIADFYKPSNMRSPIWIRKAIETLKKS